MIYLKTEDDEDSDKAMMTDWKILFRIQNSYSLLYPEKNNTGMYYHIQFFRYVSG
jgi:hypothetical protein